MSMTPEQARALLDAYLEAVELRHKTAAALDTAERSLSREIKKADDTGTLTTRSPLYRRAHNAVEIRTRRLHEDRVLERHLRDKVLAAMTGASSDVATKLAAADLSIG